MPTTAPATGAGSARATPPTLSRASWRRCSHGCSRRDRDRGEGRGFLLFLTLYCEGQILLDSTRYDALFLRSNGFVSLEQILCCAVLTAILIVGCARVLRAGGARWRIPLGWAVYLGGFGLVGYMEYYVQRHGGAYAFSYSLMAAGLALVFVGLRIAGARTPEAKPAAQAVESR